MRLFFWAIFFDDFGDSPQAFNEMIDWLEVAAEKENYIFIFGNHDMHYAFPDNKWRCSGYEQWKHFIVRDRLSTNWFQQHFKFYHVLDKTWLLSHGGLHASHIPQKISSLHESRDIFFDKLTAYLDEEIIKGYRNQSWIFRAGLCRGGFQDYGGITWCDHTMEMTPTIGLHQIYGHTPQRNGADWLIQSTSESKPKNMKNWVPSKEEIQSTNCSLNLCLDTQRNTNWAEWDGSNIVIKKYSDL